MEYIFINPGKKDMILRGENGNIISETKTGTRVAKSTYIRRRLKVGDAVIVNTNKKNNINKCEEVS